MKSQARLSGGILADMYERATKHFLYGIDPLPHIRAYEGIHPYTFAESEFAGKYLDTCVTYARRYDSPDALAHACAVAESVIRNQRADGYIGGLAVGEELDWFGIWNQAFTVLGLLSLYDLTGEEKLLHTCERIGLWVARRFTGNRDMLTSVNNGSQHLSFLLPLVRICKRSRLQELHEFAREMVRQIRSSENNFFDFASILDLSSKKGIENFVILIGILEYGELFEDPDALSACEKYWNELAETQIRENGNGTLVEFWTEGGNNPQMLSPEQKPDENCVAVGWMEFSLALFWRTGEAKYLDAVEITLFNHLAGALNDDGTDFAYYQPNFGKRITHTAENLYKCCRYRGYSAVSHFPDILFFQTDAEVIPMIYTNAEYEDEQWKISERTEYPYKGGVTFTIEVKKAGRRTLKLRIPKKTEKLFLTVNGVPYMNEPENSYLVLTQDWSLGKHEIQMEFTPEFITIPVEIDGVPRIGMTYGCLLLAAETESDGKWDSLAIDPVAVPVRREGKPILFDVGGTRVVDYASSGRKDKREFAVWARRK